MIWTEAVELHKNLVHFKDSLRLNKKNILGEYSLFFKPRMWKVLVNINIFILWINLYWNVLYQNNR